jgi:predicted flap endonuclease-1-like 5' DNA nuclease
MSEFDPYLKWLGIRETARPINHYRLLGLDLFEDDPDVISMAADRQMAHVRSYQNGPNGDLSQQLLNELARARRCLLVRGKKVQYDAQLRAKLESRSTVSKGPPSAPPMARQVVRTAPTQPNPTLNPNAGSSESPSVKPAVVPASVPSSSGLGIQADVNARANSKRRERKRMWWGMFGWISGAVAAIGVSAALLGSGLLGDFGKRKKIVDPTRNANALEANNNQVEKNIAQPGAPALEPGKRNKAGNSSLTRKESISSKLQLVEFTLENLSAYPQANPADFAVFGEVRQRLREEKTVNFESSAPSKDVRFLLLPEDTGILIGLAASTDREKNLTWVRPVFHNGFQAFTGTGVGKNNPGKIGTGAFVSIGKPGYAVGGIEVSTRSPARCFRLQFMRLSKSKIDPQDSYWGPWVGVKSGARRVISNKQGLPIVGLHGSLDDKEQVATLGLVAAYEQADSQDFVLNPNKNVTRRNALDRQPRRLDIDPLIDLKQIVGIGAKTESVLKSNGISSVKALAGLSPRQVQSVMEREGIADSNNIGQITNWIVQAKKIAGDPSAMSVSTEAIPWANEATKKLPEPSARERAVAKKNLPESVNEILNAELNSKRAAAVAANRLVLKAKTIGDPAIQYVVFEKAEELAVASGDAEIVVDAIRGIDENFEIDFWKRIQKSIDKTAGNATAETVFNFKDAMDELIDEAKENGLYTQANKLLSIAIRSAKSSQSTDLVDQYERIEDEVKFLANLRKQNSEALKTLTEDVDDPRANLHLGNFLLVCEDDLETAMRHWKKSANEKFAAIANLESEVLDSRDKLVELADGWRNLVKTSRQTPLDRKCLERAFDCYGEASRELKGREKQKVDNKMLEVRNLLNAFSNKGFSNFGSAAPVSAKDVFEKAQRERMERTQRDAFRRQMLQKEQNR